MMKFVFAGVVGLWCLVGLLGCVNAKADRVNYEMIIFLCFAPFLPLVAWACGMM